MMCTVMYICNKCIRIYIYSVYAEMISLLYTLIFARIYYIFPILIYCTTHVQTRSQASSYPTYYYSSARPTLNRTPIV